MTHESMALDRRIRRVCTWEQGEGGQPPESDDASFLVSRDIQVSTFMLRMFLRNFLIGPQGFEYRSNMKHLLYRFELGSSGLPLEH